MILEVALSLKIVVLPQWAQHGLAAPLVGPAGIPRAGSTLVF